MKRHKKYQLQPRQLQLCLLLLLVVHIILSVILVMHPSANLPQSHLPYYSYSYSHYKLPYSTKVTVDEVDYKASSSRRPRVVHIDLSDSYFIVKTVLDHNSDYTYNTIPLNQYYEDEIDNIIDYTVEDNDIIIQRLDGCKPMAKWQTMSYPTCNVLHEVNIFSTTSTLSYIYPNHDLRKDNNNKRRFPIQEPYSSKLLGHGWFRNAWEVIDPMSGTSIAIKTLR